MGDSTTLIEHRVTPVTAAITRQVIVRHRIVIQTSGAACRLSNRHTTLSIARPLVRQRPRGERSMRPRTGWVLSGLAVLFLLFDGVGKLLEVAPVLAGTAQLGYPPSVVRPIGIILLICVTIYANPRTSIGGAVLLTGYMGGAIATHLRVGSPLLTHTLFPLYVAAVFWGGLLLRDARLRALLWASGSQKSEWKPTAANAGSLDVVSSS
jgi:hypothetical protein